MYDQYRYAEEATKLVFQVYILIFNGKVLNMSGLYALRGMWKEFLANPDNAFIGNSRVKDQPYRVFWHKDNYYDWDECKRRGFDITNTTIYLRYSRNSRQKVVKCARDIVWKIPTENGGIFVHCNKQMIKKKDIFAEIRKRKRRIAGLIVTRKIGTLGFEVGSYF
tara:strand:+ start:231 stop:725 length:495 start_codon:yes stop_codon:yes gene_type:complete